MGVLQVFISFFEQEQLTASQPFLVIFVTEYQILGLWRLFTWMIE